MYIPLYQGLTPIDLVRPARRASAFPFDAPHRQYFYRARNAIYYLFQALRSVRDPLVVLVPEYHSGNEVLAIQAAGATVRYCPIDRNLRLDPAVVERLCDRYQVDVLYVIHYAGWPQPMPELVDVARRRGMWLVEDCALSLLSTFDNRPLGSFGHWSVFCLYKSLPVPNGAVLVQNSTVLEQLTGLTLRQPGAASIAGRMIELFATRLRNRAERLGGALYAMKRTLGRTANAMNVHRANVGDIGFDIEDVDIAISRTTARLLERLDFGAIHEQRVRNFRRMVELLKGKATPVFTDLPAGACPLFCPILVSDKPAAAAALASRGVEALQFWNEGVPLDGQETSPVERFMRAHVLELPIHQDLTEREIDYVARQVVTLDLRMRDAVDATCAA
jgi:dTDP-4-amino-4,6-dideoxygalactose transaminase